jgi:hypothetical protein
MRATKVLARRDLEMNIGRGKLQRTGVWRVARPSIYTPFNTPDCNCAPEIVLAFTMPMSTHERTVLKIADGQEELPCGARLKKQRAPDVSANLKAWNLKSQHDE